MDSFDDLMNPSRAALEDNPFASPFGQRSSSPDPWATPFANPNSDASFGDPTSNAFSDSTSPFASLEPSYTSLDHPPFASSEQETSEERKAQDHSVTVPTPAAATPAAVDPLDSAAALAAADDEDDDDDKPLANLRSPGFRESVAPPPSAPAPSAASAEHLHAQPFSETATIRPVGGEDLEYRHPSSSSSLSSAAPSPLITQSSPPPPSSATASSFRSPLSDNNTSSFARQSMEHSFGNLSLGGDGLGAGMGWQPEPHEQTPWQADTAPVTPQRSAYTAADEEDSDDDKPIGQTMHRNESISNTARNDNGLQPVFTITVDDPQKVGDPIRSFTMYTVHTRTTSPLFQKSAFSVLRRYSDFLWLYETLSANNPGVVVPPVPEKNTFGRFDDQFVRQRRLGLEKCIQKIANHPVLGRDPDLRMFLESDSFALDIKHRKAEIAHEKGGLMASIGQTLTGPRFHETDEWFDRQKVYLDSLELQLRGLVKAIEAVAKQRQELSVATGEFATTVTDLSTSDVGKQLAHSLSGLAEVERTAQDLQNVQAEQDISTFNATVDEYARLINSVRLAFSSRIRMYHQWRNQESELLRTKQVHEKNRAQGKIPTDRLGYSLTQIAEAERRASEAKLDYENASKLVKSEVARFEQERIDDFKDSLHAFLEGMIARQKELIGAWEAYQHMLLKKVGAVPNTA